MKSFPVAICAPSGTGKTTVARALQRKDQRLLFSVSTTTRRPRRRERDGVDYRFVSRADFQDMISVGALLEWAEVHGELYGTPRANLEQAESEGRILLLDIDVEGARQVKRARSDTVMIFLLPPSLDDLVGRLRRRGSEDEDRVRRRLQTAKGELEALDAFEYVVVNENLRETVDRIGAILTAEGHRRERIDAETRELCGHLRQGLQQQLS